MDSARRVSAARASAGRAPQPEGGLPRPGHHGRADGRQPGAGGLRPDVWTRDRRRRSASPPSTARDAAAAAPPRPPRAPGRPSRWSRTRPRSRRCCSATTAPPTDWRRAASASTCPRSPPPPPRRIGTRLAERGLAFLDAPVTGSRPKAEDGTLTIMVGGEGEAFERARPLFEAMGELVVHVGPQGHGAMAKLIEQHPDGDQRGGARPRRCTSRARRASTRSASWRWLALGRQRTPPCSSSRRGRCSSRTSSRSSSSSTCSRTCATAWPRPRALGLELRLASVRRGALRGGRRDGPGERRLRGRGHRRQVRSLDAISNVAVVETEARISQQCRVRAARSTSGNASGADFRRRLLPFLCQLHSKNGQ